MPISLDTLRRPAIRLPSISTITMSEGRIIPLLMEVGVTRMRLRSRRTDRLPSVAATNPRSCSMRPKRTISLRYWRSLAMGFLAVGCPKLCSRIVPHALAFRQSDNEAGLQFDHQYRVEVALDCTASDLKLQSVATLYNQPVLVSDFNYHLPQELIAQEPLKDRAASRMLHVDRATGRITDRVFRDFPDLLRPGDLVVLNNTRVFPARLYGYRTG